jgi:hypothetical protein
MGFFFDITYQNGQVQQETIFLIELNLIHPIFCFRFSVIFGD